MITRERQLLLNFLNICVIVNGKDIYTLNRDKPVLILLSEKHATIVATDGFHITRPVELNYHHPYTNHLKVMCAIDNNLLITGIVLLLLFSMVGIISDLPFFRALSFGPILYFLFFYYINRKDFIRMNVELK